MNITGRTFKTNKMYDWFLRNIGSGPLDGGCRTFAFALQKVIGGQVMVIQDYKGEAQHAVVMKNRMFFDADGESSPRSLLMRWKKHEGIQGGSIRPFKRGDLTVSPMKQKWIPEVVPLIQEALRIKKNPKLEGFQFSRGTNKDYGQFGGELSIGSGEAGQGIYFFPINSQSMRRYYTTGREYIWLAKLKPGYYIVDFTDSRNASALISYIKQEIDQTARQFAYYQKLKVNKTNIQRFPHGIYSYMNRYHSDAAGFIVPHRGPGVPTSKQIVITKPESIITVKR